MTQHRVSVDPAQNATPDTADDDLVVRRPVGLTDDEWAWVRERADAFWDGLLTGLAISGGER